ncbi:adenylate/guanylate cyclase domain-containing protein [Terasakiella sp. A23]|uniref:adenylate/guanylate cyclase domain-containing protein n=1 Tax=Terasakiella sp. FCG-A23 TaxID=3080561 RepID=UPI002953D976|nr:adenylate/guanylate cyclase domain-containing protein [Terasakiella sp. A23]MDV7339855.1 adenylate/guanylate cyclase domain-containing protein [Terasakiella sp. A23]
MKEFFGLGGSQKIPARVQSAIIEQQNASERLVGWIQLAVVATFGTLYAISPKTFHPDVEFVPVPYVLSLYFVFTVIRLILSYKMRLPGWVIGLSIVADILLLFGTIFSFHLQYMQPPSFYLKVPTLLYIFIFIALRTLRFEARYILLSGLAAVIGWAIMVGYVVAHDDMDTMVTRDYVQYMTSNSVLIGAEFDKIVSIILVSVILGLAVVRARTLLVQAVSQTQAAQSLSRFFSDDLADHIKSSESDASIGDVVSREASILNVDIRGFTPLTKRSTPKEQIELITEYHARIVPVISGLKGHVDKFTGDGIMAYFGVLAESDTHAFDALKAMEEIIKASDVWNEERKAAGLDPVVIHASCASGPIVFGVIGEEHRLEYTVIGDAANVSAKMEKQTKLEGVRAIATRETLECALRQGYERVEDQWELREKRDVAGVDHPLDVIVLKE